METPLPTPKHPPISLLSHVDPSPHPKTPTHLFTHSHVDPSPHPKTPTHLFTHSHGDPSPHPKHLPISLLTVM